MSQLSTSDIVILGAGVAGLATAYHLAVKQKIRNIVVVDERPPLGLTSSRGTMAYRNWFPGPGDVMVRLMNRSIDLLEQIDAETNHAIGLSQKGYTYFTANPAQIPIWRNLARDAQERGVGDFREHDRSNDYVASLVATPLPDDSEKSPLSISSGSDLVTNPEVIRELYPCVTPDVAALLHVRRCGAFDVFRLRDFLVSQIEAHGTSVVRDRVDRVSTRGNRIERIHLASGTTLSTNTLVIAVGPLLPEIARMLDLDIPVHNELHAKITLRDTARVFPRSSDLFLWSDPQTLAWTAAERETLSRSDETNYLLDEFPGGVHFLPKGTDTDPRIMGLWTYHIHPEPFTPVPTFDPHSANIVLHGLVRMIPAARVYIGHAADAVVDGGYYCKTRENRPLIGPLPIQGAYIIGALSGFGVMSALGAAEIVSAHITGAVVPPFAKEFLLSRYSDPAYLELLENWDSRSGQL